MHNNYNSKATFCAIVLSNSVLSKRAHDTKYSCCYHHRFSFDNFPSFVEFKITYPASHYQSGSLKQPPQPDLRWS